VQSCRLQVALHREISQVKAAILLRDFSRMETVQLLGSNLTSAPRPPPDVLRALVRDPALEALVLEYSCLVHHGLEVLAPLILHGVTLPTPAASHAPACICPIL